MIVDAAPAGPRPERGPARAAHRSRLRTATPQLRTPAPRAGALRVSLRVVDPEADETAWSRIFDHSLDVRPPFVIEDDIAAAASSALYGHDGV